MCIKSAFSVLWTGVPKKRCVGRRGLDIAQRSERRLCTICPDARTVLVKAFQVVRARRVIIVVKVIRVGGI